MSSSIRFLPVFALVPLAAHAGIFAPPAGQTNSDAVPAGDAAIEAWATGFIDYQPGTNVDAEFQTPQRSLGVAGDSDGTAIGTTFDIVALGRGGSITLTFRQPIFNDTGFDFAVFENGFSDTFLELAKVEVSSDGTTFYAFPGLSTVPNPVAAFGAVDATDLAQVAGKYRAGFGTPFDLEQLAGLPNLNINDVRYVRLTDIVGDGSATNDMSPANLAAYLGIDVGALPQLLVDISVNAPAAIYDPFPTVGSAGFDLDAIAVLNAGDIPADMDINPFDANNEIDPEGTAAIPVTLLSTQIASGDSIDFDATEVDPATVSFGPAGATAVSGPFMSDIDADGDIDSSFTFQTQDTGLTCDDMDMTLTAHTLAAEPVTAIDFVTTTNCDTASCHP